MQSFPMRMLLYVAWVNQWDHQYNIILPLKETENRFLQICWVFDTPGQINYCGTISVVCLLQKLPTQARWKLLERWSGHEFHDTSALASE